MVVVNLCDVEIGMVVFRPVHLSFDFVYEGVGFEANSLYVEVGDVEDVVFRHQWFRWCSWWSVNDYSDDSMESGSIPGFDLFFRLDNYIFVHI